MKYVADVYIIKTQQSPAIYIRDQLNARAECFTTDMA